MPASIGISTTATAWNRKARQKEMAPDIPPFPTAVNNDDVNAFIPIIRKARL